MTKDIFKKFCEDKIRIQEISKKNGWVFKYDSVSDILYFFDPSKKMDADSIQIPTSEECASLMVKGDGSIIGIVIEDFVDYYAPMHEEYEKLANVVLKKKDQEIDPYKKPKELGIFSISLSSIGVKAEQLAMCGR